MENIEDIVFDRLCRYLETWKIDFRLDENGYYCVYIDGNQVLTLKWRSKKNIFTDFDFTDFDHMQMSFFHVCRSYNNIIAAGNEDVLWLDEIYLANIYEKLKLIEADSYEEMLIKMDLAGV